MPLLKNMKDISSLKNAVAQCAGDVMLRSADGSEEFNLKSAFSEQLAISRLCEERGDEYEVFCMNSADEHYLFSFFAGLAG